MTKVANIAKELLADDLAYYSSQHKTNGCKITHMIGVPIIVASILVWPFNRKVSGRLQTIGWFFQLLGHLGFERNTPVVLEVQSPSMLAVSIIFVVERWKRFLTGRRI